MQTAKITHMHEVRAGIIAGRGAWPPPSPWIWQDSWWTPAMVKRDIILTWNFDGGLAFTSLGYDLDPGCPWEYLIVTKPDSTRITHQIPRVSRTGTITAAQLLAKGLHLFTDIASITVGSSPS